MLCQRLEVEYIMAVESQYYCLHCAEVVDLFSNTVTVIVTECYQVLTVI